MGSVTGAATPSRPAAARKPNGVKQFVRDHTTVATVGAAIGGIAAWRGFRSGQKAFLIHATPTTPNQAALDSLAAHGLLEASGNVRLLHGRSGQTLDALERQLATGRVVSGSERALVPKSQEGVNGTMQTKLLESPDGSAAIRAIERPPAKDGLEEIFAWQLARKLGIDHLFAGAAQRSGAPAGTAMVEHVPGNTFKLQETSDRSIHGLLRANYDLTHPGLPSATREKLATIDQQLLQFFDYLTANFDRHGGNVLADRATGAVHYIDQGAIAWGESLNPLRPTMKPESLNGIGGAGTIRLDPETVEVIRQRLTPDDLRELHNIVKTRVESGPPRTMKERVGPLQDALVRSSWYEDNMVMRRNHALRSGTLTYDNNSMRRRINTMLARKKPAPGAAAAAEA